MNILGAILLSILLIGSCHENKNTATVSHRENSASVTDSTTTDGNLKSGLIKVDVTKDYPKKDFNWEDLADIEFIPLETKADFLCDEKGRVFAVTDDKIFFHNWKEGTVFIFSRKGKALTKFNRKGGGGEEYIGISQAVLDHENKELYINDMWKKKIFVYDFVGKYKRSFRHHPGSLYSKIASFNDSTMICYDRGEESRAGKASPFIIVSKKTGKKIRDIIIPFDKRLEVEIIKKSEDIWIGESTPVFPIIKTEDGFLLNEVSSDTLYKLKPNYELQAVVTRTPPVQTMDPTVFLLSDIETNRYLFVDVVTKKYDWKTNIGFPRVHLGYDYKDCKVYEYKICYESPDQIIDFNLFPKIERECYINKNTFVGTIQSYLLKKMKDNDELQGQLKQIAQNIKEDDNPVLMLIKFKE